MQPILFVSGLTILLCAIGGLAAVIIGKLSAVKEPPKAKLPILHVLCLSSSNTRPEIRAGARTKLIEELPSCEFRATDANLDGNLEEHIADKPDAIAVIVRPQDAEHISRLFEILSRTEGYEPELLMFEEAANTNICDITLRGRPNAKDENAVQIDIAINRSSGRMTIN